MTSFHVQNKGVSNQHALNFLFSDTTLIYFINVGLKTETNNFSIIKNL